MNLRQWSLMLQDLDRTVSCAFVLVRFKALLENMHIYVLVGKLRDKLGKLEIC